MIIVSQTHLLDSPIGVKNRSCMTSKKWNQIRKFSSRIKGNNSKCTTSRSLPVDRQVLGISLSRVLVREAQDNNPGLILTLIKFESHAFLLPKKEKKDWHVSILNCYISLCNQYSTNLTLTLS